MKKLLLLIALLMSGCAQSIQLPLTVYAKYQRQVGVSSVCKLVMQTSDNVLRDTLVFETPYDEVYCAYQVGQEVK